MCTLARWQRTLTSLADWSNEDTRAVHAAVETNLRVIETQFPPDSDGGFEYLKKREALYDQALEMTKTPRLLAFTGAAKQCRLAFDAKG